jgi:acetolactate synthase I/II/III large subunit
MNGAQLLVRELRERGVDFVSTLCGHGLNPFFAAAAEVGLRLVDTRNEQAAAYIAEAYGRLSRRVGVCAVSSGVAHANAMTGVVNAYFDGAPMLLISGSAALQTQGMGHFQDLDQVALVAPASKYARLVHLPERIPQMIEEAFGEATSGRPGPVHLTLPMDVQTAVIDPVKVVRSPKRTSKVSLTALGDPDLIAETAKWLGEAVRPLVVAGSGVFYSEGEAALAAFVGNNALPVVVPIWDRGPVPKPLEEFMGVLGAASGGPGLLGEADLVILAGARVDYRVCYLQAPAVREDARIIRIDVDPAELHKGVEAHLSIQGDPRSVLTQIDAECRRMRIPPHTSWLQEAQRRRQRFRGRVVASRQNADKGLHAMDVLQAIATVLTEDTVLLFDGGNIGQWAHQILCDRYPGHWLTCGASGAVGWGLPGAIAARLLYPNRPIILLSGDGSFTFTIAELETAARQALNFVVLVADDEAWGITLSEHLREFGRGFASEPGPIRFDLAAQAFGCQGRSISSPDELLPSLREGLACRQPAVIHVPIVKSSPSNFRTVR